MSTVDILSHLVSFACLGGESNTAVAEWIEQYLTSQGVAFQTVPHESDDKRSIFCRIGPDQPGGIILSGHMDVVPVAGQSWTTEPFSLIDRDDKKLYGRGTCDMKGFIASCLAAVPSMVVAQLQRPIYLAFSYDEEVGCLSAPALAQAIKQYATHAPSIAVIGEPSMMKPVQAHKGIAIFCTTVNGSAGHSSRICQSVSAIHEAARLIMWLENHMLGLKEGNKPDNRFDPSHTTIHVGMLDQSGIATNVIADRASFTWDVRVVPGDNAHNILSSFQEFCQKLKSQKQKLFADFDITTEVLVSPVPALDTDASAESVKLIQNLTGASEILGVSYAAEAGQFSEAGFDAVICGPGDIAQAHQPDEFIHIDQLKACDRMIDRLIQHCSG